MAERVRAIDCGGIGAFHLLACNSGLADAINQKVNLLKRHLPYHESDHVLNIAYNTLTGGTCLDDIELRRNDEAFMDGLGTERIPDPTTAGDFTRRFCEGDVIELIEAINSIRPKLWKKRLHRRERGEAIIDTDGTHALTWGECKEGIGLSYDGQWCYHPLLISLANTMEPLYLVNRSGNCVSHDGAVAWIDRAIGLVRQSFEGVFLRGDTDFALTAHFDHWTAEGVGFAFGMDAMTNLVQIAEGLEDKRWRVMRRREEPSPFEVFLVAETQDVITTTGGLKVVPDYTLDNCPSFDVLLVPGGWGTRKELGNERNIKWISDRARKAETVASVCTGAMLLGRAGLLDGRRATTHLGFLELDAGIISRRDG